MTSHVLHLGDARDRVLARGVRDPESGCLIYGGYKNAHGYGVVHFGGRTMLAHRVVAGAVDEPVSVVVRHSCDRPSCIEPSHLLRGTVADNVHDMYERGRARHVSGDAHPRRQHPELWPTGDRHWAHLHPGALAGERNGRARLTVEQVAEIRRRARPGRGRGPGVQADSFRALAREFGVDRRTIGQIVKGETWAA